MIRTALQTLVVLFALIMAVLFLPLWVQLALFFIAVWVAPNRLLLLVPAILSDVLYSPTGQLSLHMLLMTLVVGVLLVVRWLLLSYTRFSSVIYGVET